MAAVEVTISGVLYDKVNRTTQNVVLIGEATLTGLGPGGGPIIPPPSQPPGGGGGTPPGIWPGPGPLPHPEHPIAPGGPPPSVWPNPPEGSAPHPEHPIVLPPPTDKPPEPINPPIAWKAVWHPTEGWIVVGLINPEVEHPVPS